MEVIYLKMQQKFFATPLNSKTYDICSAIMRQFQRSSVEDFKGEKRWKLRNAKGFRVKLSRVSAGIKHDNL